jgi:hypothetical protein
MSALDHRHMDAEESITGVVADSLLIATLLGDVVDAFINVGELRRDPASLWTEQSHRRLRRIRAAVHPEDV